MLKRYEVKDLLVALLGFISVCLLFLDQYDTSYLRNIILLIFYIFVSSEFIKAKNKWKYIRTHPLEIIALIPMEGIFQGLMIIRVCRLVVVIKFFQKLFPSMSAILVKNGLYRVFIFTIVVIMLSAIPISYFEEGINSIAEGVWWAIVTTTTVGYGDIAPVTTGGRIVAVILMLTGIGCIGTITANVAAYFYKTDDSNVDKEYLKKKIDDIEKLTTEEYKRFLDILETVRGGH